MNLFCFPFAGGGKHSYRGLAGQAPRSLHVIPVDLPGRGSRVMEPLLTSMEEMAEDLWCQLKGHLRSPHALYGHSMGTLLVYLITHRIIREGYPPPAHLFLTGCRAPSVRRSEEPAYALSREDFIGKVRELGGMTDEVLNDETLMAFFEPILRADFQAVETFVYKERPPFHIPLTIITGTEEKATYEEVQAWRQETTADVEIRRMPGKHFFIFNYEKEIMDLITDRLRLDIAVQ